MKIENEKLKLTWQREGLRIDYDGNYVAVLDITDISLLKIYYGSDLDIQPEGWFITPREKVIKWLKAQNGKGRCPDKGQAEIASHWVF